MCKDLGCQKLRARINLTSILLYIPIAVVYTDAIVKIKGNRPTFMVWADRFSSFISWSDHFEYGIGSGASSSYFPKAASSCDPPSLSDKHGAVILYGPLLIDS